MPFTLANAQIQEAAGDGNLVLSPDDPGTLIGSSIVSSTFTLRGRAPITVTEGEIVLNGHGVPELLVRTGKVEGGRELTDERIELPGALEATKGYVQPLPTENAFPEGQTTARESPHWLRRALYGKSA
jgi:hypothetical protein